MLSIEFKNEFIELRAKGNSFQSISKTLGVSKQTLINWSKELNIQINNLRAIELEVIVEKYKLSKEFKLRNYCKLLNSLQNELDSRNLSEISTSKLLDIYMKTHGELYNEFRQIKLADESFSLASSSWDA